jgi:hypothetical protein
MMGDQITAEFGEPNRPLAGLRLLLVEDQALVAMGLEELISTLTICRSSIVCCESAAE